MTVSESLIAINSYPIPEVQVNKICILRALITGDEFTKVIGESESYELATADIYFYLSGHPSLVEQEVGINNALAVKQNFLKLANSIYQKYDDPKYSGFSYGFKGESYNG